MASGGFDDKDISLSRRTHDRFSVQAAVQYFIKGRSRQFQEGTLVNISRSGASMQLDEPVDLGQMIFLELMTTDLRQINLRGQVKWFDAGKKTCGLAFSTLMNSVEISSLMLQADRGDGRPAESLPDDHIDIEPDIA